ncbi:MAG: hypothetical protein Q9182_006140 [Xanthomendoza sp. 2 TL-2023]
MAQVPILDHIQAFQGKFKLEEYSGFEDVLDSGRCLTEIKNFMKLVQDCPNLLIFTDGKQLVDEFCELVNHEDVWHLAEIVVPYFRLSKLENYLEEDGADHTCLNYILNRLDRFDRLPPPPIDMHTFTNEQDMLQRRIESYFTYLGSAGAGIDPTPEKKRMVKDLLEMFDRQQDDPSTHRTEKRKELSERGRKETVAQATYTEEQGKRASKTIAQSIYTKVHGKQTGTARGKGKQKHVTNSGGKEPISRCNSLKIEETLDAPVIRRQAKQKEVYRDDDFIDIDDMDRSSSEFENDGDIDDHNDGGLDSSSGETDDKEL